MNNTFPIHLPIPIPILLPNLQLQLPPSIHRLSHDLTRAIVYLLIPTELLYFSIYFLTKRCFKTHKVLTALSLATFLMAPLVSPIGCGAMRSLQNFVVAIGSMKLLDIWARRRSLPTWASGRPPPDWLLSLFLLTELRYESFTPNHIRVPKTQENFNEPLQFAIHTAIFALLQSLPQNLPTVLAFEVLLAIYIIWTSMQLLLRYKSSPALFGPLYLADSLTGFWSETWHNAFASPCTSLAYRPLRDGLTKYGFPDGIARSMGVLGAFTLMAVFHMYSLTPILHREALYRVGIFFLLNGIATVAEAMIWGKKRHWIKAALAWIFQTALASWVAAGLNIPNGLSRIPWGELCDAPKF